MATFEKKIVQGYGSLEDFAKADGCYRIYESDTGYHVVRKPADEESILGSPYLKNLRVVWPENIQTPAQTTAISSRAQTTTTFLSRLRAGFSKFASETDVHLAPNISKKKLANARAAARVPDTEEVIAVIDCTIFGSAKDSLTFGTKGIYLHGPFVTQRFGKESLTDRWDYLTIAQGDFRFKGKTVQLVGKYVLGLTFSFAGTSAPVEEILNMVKAEALNMGRAEAAASTREPSDGKEAVAIPRDVQTWFSARQIDASVHGLIQALCHADPKVVLMAASTLEKAGDQVVQPLTDALKDQDPERRSFAANLLGKIGSAEAAEALIAALEDQDARVRDQAIGALVQIHEPRALEYLLRWGNSDDPEVRKAAMYRLGDLLRLEDLVDPRGMAALTAGLEDNNPSVRQAAEFCLQDVEKQRASTTNRTEGKVEHIAGQHEEGREITFVIPCGACGYKTSVTVVIDWVGNILSGSATDHEFRCQNCEKVFSVSKDSLKQYTNRFV